jgi:hypothetical protein
MHCRYTRHSLHSVARVAFVACDKPTCTTTLPSLVAAAAPLPIHQDTDVAQHHSQPSDPTHQQTNTALGNDAYTNRYYYSRTGQSSCKLKACQQGMPAQPRVIPVDTCSNQCHKAAAAICKCTALATDGQQCTATKKETHREITPR